MIKWSESLAYFFQKFGIFSCKFFWHIWHKISPDLAYLLGESLATLAHTRVSVQGRIRLPCRSFVVLIYIYSGSWWLVLCF